MAVQLKLAKQQRMKRSIIDTISISHFHEDELEVAEILLHLPKLISEEKFRPLFLFSWGVKRRRSAIDVSPSPPPPPAHPLLPHLCNGEKPVTKVESTSPATPLSYSPSESDWKLKLSKRKSSKKKTKEELIHTVSHLSENLQILKQELPKTRAHYEMLKEINLKLKGRQLQLSVCWEPKKELNLNSISRTSSDPLLEQTEITVPSPASQEEVEQEDEEEEEDSVPIIVHQPASAIAQVKLGSEIVQNSQYPCGQVPHLLLSEIGLRVEKHLNPLGIPDLNISAEEYCGMDFLQPFDVNRRAIAAQARKRRIAINRIKSSMPSVKKLRY